VFPTETNRNEELTQIRNKSTEKNMEVQNEKQKSATLELE
jgi:hypothetical protein